MPKQRLDVLLVSRGLAESREKAKAIIMTGNVFVKNERIDKAGQAVPDDCPIEIKGKPMKYVSRGGYKLERAIESFAIDLNGKVCLDVGSSTGGFTDCMLQNGAVKVIAVDVGTNKLAWKLRKDPRVVSMEKTNIRYVTPEDMKEKAEFASVDVAFISLTRVLEPIYKLMEYGGEIVCLIKPQFEAGREKVGKKGVVRSKDTHQEVVEMVTAFAAECKLTLLGLDFSPIRGPEGNIEYLLYMRKEDGERSQSEWKREIIREVVERAHGRL
ncbi:MAG: TlyA family RNA methyltransferase [Lachnoclostridium sp.]|jgi:23S rRNA (cytidine1920-2'-O)/16S rRNA (cytidine1409-2'-O)-methyltransferase|nr:TlyA family RNA methyltransferase [Lachnoclostridium sp.]